MVTRCSPALSWRKIHLIYVHTYINTHIFLYCCINIAVFCVWGLNLWKDPHRRRSHFLLLLFICCIIFMFFSFNKTRSHICCGICTSTHSLVVEVRVLPSWHETDLFYFFVFSCWKIVNWYAVSDSGCQKLFVNLPGERKSVLCVSVDTGKWKVQGKTILAVVKWIEIMFKINFI